ncbi:hypothetical protein MMPV_007110 [Pyropia vietnamensis]
MRSTCRPPSPRPLPSSPPSPPSPSSSPLPSPSRARSTGPPHPSGSPSPPPLPHASWWLPAALLSLGLFLLSTMSREVGSSGANSTPGTTTVAAAASSPRRRPLTSPPADAGAFVGAPPAGVLAGGLPPVVGGAVGTTPSPTATVTASATAPVCGRRVGGGATHGWMPPRGGGGGSPCWWPPPAPSSARRRVAAPPRMVASQDTPEVAQHTFPPAPAWVTAAAAHAAPDGKAAAAAADVGTSAATAAAAAIVHGNGGVGGGGVVVVPPTPASGLSDLRSRLLRQEETIIFALIERSQFRLNPLAYTPGALVPGYPGTFSRYLLHELEVAYAKTRRYTSPDEHPFTDGLPDSVLPPLAYPATLVPNNINVNAEIEAAYVGQMLPRVCEGGDDQNYGSSATCDVACLQALSKRVHYGKFVAEAKFQEDPAAYTALVRAGDREGIWEALTNSAVEEVLLRRVRRKAMAYGGDVRDVPIEGAGEGKYKVDPAAIADIYREIIIPLTKKVEVDYLMQRV